MYPTPQTKELGLREIENETAEATREFQSKASEKPSKMYVFYFVSHSTNHNYLFSCNVIYICLFGSLEHTQ